MIPVKAKLLVIEQAYKHRKKILVVLLCIIFIPVIVLEAMNPFRHDEWNDPYIQAYNNVVYDYDIQDLTISVDTVRAIENVLYLDISNRTIDQVQQNLVRFYIEQTTKQQEVCDESNKCTTSSVRVWQFKDKDDILDAIDKVFGLSERNRQDIEFMLQFQPAEINTGNIDGSVAITRGDFVLPVDKFTITAGTWNYPASFGGGWHPGIDIANRIGTPVRAPINVTRLGTFRHDGGYGTHIALAGQLEKDSFVFIMAHNSRNVDKATFKQGETVAYMGSTGFSTGPHLHLEVFYFPNTKLDEVIKLYRKHGYWFGLGYGNKGNCNKVCRQRPEEVFGLRVGQVR